MLTGTMTSFYNDSSVSCYHGMLRQVSHLRRELQDFGFDTTKEVRLKSSMQFRDKFICELFILLRENLQVSPFIRVEEVHKIEQFTNIVVEGRLEKVLS